MAESSYQKQANDIVASLENVFKGAPHLPENIRLVLVKIAPWIALIFGILGIIAGLEALRLSPIAFFGGLGLGLGVYGIIAGLIMIVSSIILLLAYPKLVKRASGGWMFLFYAEMLNFISSLLTLSLGSIVGSLIGVIIGLYLLFEIKGYYK